MVHGQNNNDNIIIGILGFILICLGIVYYAIGIVKGLNIIIQADPNPTSMNPKRSKYQ